MERITYISTYGEDITKKDIEGIGRKSQENNARDNLTGALFCFKGVFYQIIEGEAPQLYRCFSRIHADPRHSEIFVLNVEKDIKERLYSQWNMKTVELDENTDPLLNPIRNLLDSLTRTHRTLANYAPLEVLEGIQQGNDPLAWGFKRDELVVLFSDLIGFSTITEKSNLEEIRAVLDNYFEIAFSTITNSGGTISKLTGDGFMAYYSTEAAQSALKASAQIIKGLKKQREEAQSPFLKLSYCGIGLSAGPVIKGNIGSMVKKDYTVLGDIVNSASRLEAHTRKTGHSILFDQRFKKYLPENLDMSILSLGEFVPKGTTKKLTIYTVDDPDIPLDRTPGQIAQEIVELHP